MDTKITMTQMIIDAYKSGRYASHNEIALAVGRPEKYVKTTKRRVEIARGVTFAKDVNGKWILLDEDDVRLEAERVRRLKFAESDAPAAASLQAGSLEAPTEEEVTA